MSGLARLWRLLTEAPTDMTSSERRRQVQLLSGLLIVVIVSGLTIALLQWLLLPGFGKVFAIIAAAALALLVTYVITRRGFYTVAAMLAIAVTLLASFAVIWVRPDVAIAYAYLVVNIFLARLFFAERGVLIVAAVNLFILVFVLPVLGVASPYGDSTSVPMFIAIFSVFMLLAIRYRNTVERDRKAELAASEARLRDFADATLEGVVFTENGGIIDINERGAALVGATSSAALIGRNILDFCAPADRERVATQMRNNVSTPYEFTIRRMDGSEFPGVVRGRTSLYHNRPVRVTVFRDLTERRHIEAALRDREQLLRLVLDSLPVGVWVTDKQGKIVSGNPEGLRIWAGSRYVGTDQYGEYKGWWADTGKPIAADEWALARAIRHGETSLNEVIDIECFDGARKTILNSAVPIRADGNEIAGAIVVNQDITERKRAEETLRASEARLKEAQRLAHIGSWDLDLATNHLVWSDEIFRIFEIDPSRFGALYEAFLDAIHPDDREAVDRAYTDSVRNRTPYTIVHRLRMADGRIKHVQERGETFYDETGRALRTVGTVQDITERQHAEQALIQSESNFRALTENANVGILVNHGGKHVFANNRLLAILGYTADEIYETGVKELVHPQEYDKVMTHFRERLDGRTAPGVYETVFMTKDRQAVPVELTATKTTWQGEPAGLVFLRDISERLRTEAALRQSEQQLRSVVSNLPVVLYTLDRNGVFTLSEGKGLEALGLKPGEVVGQSVFDLFAGQAGVLDDVRRALAGETRRTATKVNQLVFDSWYSPLQGSHGNVTGVIGVATDITERVSSETQMRKLSSALEQTADSVVITDRQGTIEYVNPGFEKTTGYSRDEAVGQTPRLVKSGKQGAGFYKKLWNTILAGEVFSEVFVNRRKDGSLYYEEKTISPLKGPAGQVTHFVATGKDVTERMQTQERLQHMAQHDALTELPNRALFLDRLKQALARARWHKRLVAVLFVDMDRFKTINDTLGHEIGDKLLQALAERFSASVREGDTVARFGGDEFVVLLDDVASEKDIGALAQKVIEMLAPPFEVDGQSLYITASIGVSLYPNDGEDSTTLIKNADIAMYRAKDLGKNTYQFYSADMSARAFERLTLESSLRHAIERHEFRLYYQPQIDSASGAILGVEALLRWQHPDFGLVAPAEFIPLLEETGLIVPVGDWVFRTACEQLCAWHAAGWPTLRMAVNLSPRQFQAAGLAIMVERGLATVGCDPGLIELEITENVLLRHAAATLDTLDALRTLGVRLAIDDFGTGYSSLSYLRRYSIDTLKIDRSFVHDVPGDPDDSAITSAIIVLAQSLKLDVIAEGVETEAQRNFLQERGCQVMQGYLFSRPLPAEDITRLLEKAGPQMHTDGRGRET